MEGFSVACPFDYDDATLFRLVGDSLNEFL